MGCVEIQSSKANFTTVQTHITHSTIEAMKFNRGLPYAIAAYTLWGLFPIYWKLLSSISPFEIIAQRVVWSFVFTAILLSIARGWRDLFIKLQRPKTFGTLILSSFLIGANWLIYVWGVNTGKIVQCSLGYFMLPLMSVFMGAVFLHEQLKPAQILAIICAGIGVTILTFDYGAFPWISLTLAISFSTYGLLRKTVGVEALQGLSVETAVCAIPSLIYIYWLEAAQQAAFLHSDLQTNILLVGSGIITTLPLLWFTVAARLMRLSSLGILQYFAPTIQFLLGVLVFHETFNRTRLFAFCFIWLGLMIFSIGTIRSLRATQNPAAS